MSSRDSAKQRLRIIAEQSKLIQMLVDDVHALREEFYHKGAGYRPATGEESLAEARRHGFAPRADEVREG